MILELKDRAFFSVISKLSFILRAVDRFYTLVMTYGCAVRATTK